MISCCHPRLVLVVFAKGRQIDKSTIAQSTVIRGGVKIYRSNVLSLSHVSESLFDHDPPQTAGSRNRYGGRRGCELVVLRDYACQFHPSLRCSWQRCRHGLAWLGVAASITAQSITCTALCCIWQMVALSLEGLQWKIINPGSSPFMLVIFAARGRCYGGHLFALGSFD